VREIGTLFGRPIAQYWEDIELWETVLNEWELRIGWILELGTWQGGFSFFLYAQASARGIEFTTLDNVRPDKFVAGYNEWNIMAGLPEFVEDSYKKFPGLVFCDNGFKPKEVELYVDLVHEESLFAVHDWGTEFIPTDIPESLAACNYSSTTIFLANRKFLKKIGKAAFDFK
jgi:hypothetical protein